MKFDSDFRQVGTPVSSTIKNSPPQNNWDIVESGEKHLNPNSSDLKQLKDYTAVVSVIAWYMEFGFASIYPISAYHH
jgi:hypothetical protein